MIPGCQCEECRARWTADVVEYAAFLEETVLEIEMPLDQPGSDGHVHRMIEGLAAWRSGARCARRSRRRLKEEDRRHAAEERAAGGCTDLSTNLAVRYVLLSLRCFWGLSWKFLRELSEEGSGPSARH